MEVDDKILNEDLQILQLVGVKEVIFSFPFFFLNLIIETQSFGNW
jgi:hypothetical protein